MSLAVYVLEIDIVQMVYCLTQPSILGGMEKIAPAFGLSTLNTSGWRQR